jgi:hypothetical protein
MKQIKTLVSLFVLLLLPLLAQAQFLQPTNPPATVMLAWDPSTSADVGSYNVYYGVASGNYTNKVNVTSTNATIMLARGATYYFACTAVSTNGLESLFSNEISYRPAVPPIAPVLRLVIKQAGTIGSIQGTAEPYALVTVQYATDLRIPTWSQVGDATRADGSGAFSVTDPAQANQKLYRAYF